MNLNSHKNKVLNINVTQVVLINDREMILIWIIFLLEIKTKKLTNQIIQ